MDLVPEDGAIVLNCENIGKLGQSDHRMIKTHIRGEFPEKITSSTYTDWRNADVASCEEYLGNINWQEELLNLGVEE